MEFPCYISIVNSLETDFGISMYRGMVNCALKALFVISTNINFVIEA